MNEREVAKEALKKKYLEVIAEELFAEAKGKIPSEDVSVDDKGKLLLDIDDNDVLKAFVKYLANTLAEAKAELCLQNQLFKKS